MKNTTNKNENVKKLIKAWEHLTSAQIILGDMAKESAKTNDWPMVGSLAHINENLSDLAGHGMKPIGIYELIEMEKKEATQ